MTRYPMYASREVLVGLAIAVALLMLPKGVQAQWTTSGNDAYNTNSGNVGVGTTSPAYALDITSASDKQLQLNGNSGRYVSEYPSYNAAQKGQCFYDNTNNLVGVGGSAATVSLQLLYGVGIAGLTMLGSSGNVGIGTTSPSSKLDVNGDVTVSGNISAKYQDLAEWVPAVGSIPSGSVVVLDKSRDNSVMQSTLPYDTRVAGVISSTPGIVLGEATPDKVKVATTGRVKVRVDASHGPIEVGDLLVTSDKAGMAMRSEPVDVAGIKIHQPGTLIGKALQPLAEDEGEILVLLSLR